jgi:tetratricopeptide (TPR) repeat protein
LAILVVIASLFTMGAGCSSDPNVEGAKLDLRNKDFDRALINLNKALETNPANYEAYLLKGQAYQEMASVESDVEKHTELIGLMQEAYDGCLQNLPAEETAMRDEISQRSALAWYSEYQRGLASYNRENYSEAAVFFTNATQIQPDSSATYVNLAFAYISGEQMTEAISPLEMAIEHGDRNPDTYNYLSDLYLDNDRSEDAVALLKEARSVFDDNAEATARLFNAYVRTGQVAEALALAEEEVASDPEDKLHRYNLGSLLLEAERYEEAIVQLEKAVEIDPDYVSALFNLGAAYQNRGVSLNDSVNEVDEKLRAEGDQLSDDDRKALETEMEALAAERDELFAASIAPLMNARELSSAAGEDVTGICSALGQAYARTNQMAEAEEAYKCAEGN